MVGGGISLKWLACNGFDLGYHPSQLISLLYPCSLMDFFRLMLRNSFKFSHTDLNYSMIQPSDWHMLIHMDVVYKRVALSRFESKF